jgi:hypothetical protein
MLDEIDSNPRRKSQGKRGFLIQRQLLILNYFFIVEAGESDG